MSSPVAIVDRPRLAVHRRPLPWLAVAAARLLMRRSPARIRTVLELLRRGARPATTEEAARSRAEVVAVSVSCAGEGCVQRSLATTLLCRLRGHWPTWCSGVRVVPFLAHAWVEVDDEPVDEPYPRGYHTTLIRVPPRERS
ncbi:lasso peptide biosynthesis B2 protein [Streptomyces zaomyceticus]|uniref:lasso peptide biosynthesis B2 protein n=1 Tax=Streptomyces zaomyceticus TaxID=68286 RepID=UPI00371471FD